MQNEPEPGSRPGPEDIEGRLLMPEIIEKTRAEQSPVDRPESTRVDEEIVPDVSEDAPAASEIPETRHELPGRSFLSEAFKRLKHSSGSRHRRSR